MHLSTALLIRILKDDRVQEVIFYFLVVLTVLIFVIKLALGSVAEAALGNSGDWLFPLPGDKNSYTVTSLFGNRVHPIFGQQSYHSGTDIAGPQGTDLLAVGNGKVVLAEWYGGYGNAVILDLGEDLFVLYGHMSNYNVTNGQTVKKGDVVGYMGSTGNSTGSHLHLEFRQGGINGEVVDSENYIDYTGVPVNLSASIEPVRNYYVG